MAEEQPSGAVTHYAVIAFSGDPAEEHPDEALRGREPHLEVIAKGPEDFCWRALADWTAEHPLLLWQEAEVLQRHPSIVHPPIETAEPPPGCPCGDDHA